MSQNLKPEPPLDIAIVGTGIGGASAAVALTRAGLNVEVFEQASELKEIGGAIIIRQPSATLFQQWGILNDLRPKMVEIRDLELLDKGGALTDSRPIVFDSEEGVSASSVHRADVHNALLSQIPCDRLHLDHRLRAIDKADGIAEASFENGRTVRARCLIGADGLRSKVRAHLDQSEMRFDKIVTHRTIAPASLLPPGMPNDRLRMWMSGPLLALTLPIRGGSEVAIDAMIPTEKPPEKLWSATSDDELLAYFADFDPLIAKLVRGRTVAVTTHPVYDKDPIERWTDGVVVLMGDAAHPMAPRQGQGANQAIQDAGALSEALSSTTIDGWPAALGLYQARRAPVTARLQLLSRQAPERRG